MTTDFRPSNVNAIWQTQPVEGDAMTPMSIDAIRRRAGERDERVKRMRMLRGGAFLVVLAGASWAMWRLPNTFTRTGCAIVAATALVAILRSAIAARAAKDREHIASAGEAFLRRALIDRRDATSGVIVWQLAPIAIGTAIFLIGLYLQAPERWQWPAAIWVLASAHMAVARWRIERTVKKYQKEIDALDAAETR